MDTKIGKWVNKEQIFQSVSLFSHAIANLTQWGIIKSSNHVPKMAFFISLDTIKTSDFLGIQPFHNQKYI